MKEEAQGAVEELLNDTKAGYLLWYETTRRRQGYTAERVGEWFFLDDCGRYLEVHADGQTSPWAVSGKDLLPLLEEVEEQCQKRAARDRMDDSSWEKANKRKIRHPSSYLSYPAPIEEVDDEEEPQ